MQNDLEQHTKERMQKAMQALENALSRLRAGRANPSLLEQAHVSYYGSEVPLNQVAQIIAEGPLMLVVKPFEKRMLGEIEKAIRLLDLGLNPATMGEMIRVPLPPLSEERRRELVKKVKTEVEGTKVAIRNVRRECNQAIKDQLKNKVISEDLARRQEESVQKMTDRFIQEADLLMARKEQELLAI